jgi:hypothetical protein
VTDVKDPSTTVVPKPDPSARMIANPPSGGTVVNTLPYGAPKMISPVWSGTSTQNASRAAFQTVEIETRSQQRLAVGQWSFDSSR